MVVSDSDAHAELGCMTHCVVLCCAGTGYFVEKQIPDAKTFINVSRNSLHTTALLADRTNTVSLTCTCCSLLVCCPQQSKLAMLADNIDKVGIALSGKRRDLEAVTVVLQAKMQAVKQAQDRELSKITA